MSTFKGTVKWFKQKRALVLLKEKTKKKMHLYMLQQ